MSDKMREEFEKWLDKGNHCGCNENMWKAWQAAQSTAVPELPDPTTDDLALFERVVGPYGYAGSFERNAIDLYANSQTHNCHNGWQHAMRYMREQQSVPVVGEPVAQNPSRMCVVFDGPPSGEAPRFIEVEDGNGNSINAGEWLKRDDGLWELRLIAHLPLNASTTHSTPAAELATLREKAAEVDELRKDAERYRWLQKQSSYLLKKLQQASMTDSGDVTYFHADKFDAAIDAAIAGENHG